MGKAIIDVHLPGSQCPEESVFDGGIGEFCNHEDEKRDNSD